jgi:hypothetical protein
MQSRIAFTEVDGQTVVDRECAKRITLSQGGVPMNRLVFGLLTLGCLLATPGQGRPNMVFFDGTFNDLDWFVPHQSGAAGGALNFHGQAATGGNPGSWRYNDLFVGQNQPDISNLNITFAFDPSAQGAVTGITFAADLITTNAAGAPYYPLLSQGGVLYVDFQGQELATSNNWFHQSQTLQLGDFSRLDGQPGAPDFSSGGSTITFGYEVIAGGAGFFYADTGIDNLSITVTSTSPAIATPEPHNLTLVGMAVVCVVGYAWRPKRGAACSPSIS